MHGLLSHGCHVEVQGTEKFYIVSLEIVPMHVNSRLRVRNLCSLTDMPPVNGLVVLYIFLHVKDDFLFQRLISCTCQSFLISCYSSYRKVPKIRPSKYKPLKLSAQKTPLNRPSECKSPRDHTLKLIQNKTKQK